MGYNYQPPPGYRPEPPRGHSSGEGTTILVLGILSLVICGLLGPVAWVMGNNAMERSSPYDADRGMIQAGRICGIIATCLIALGICVWVAILGSAAATGRSMFDSSQPSIERLPPNQPNIEAPVGPGSSTSGVNR